VVLSTTAVVASIASVYFRVGRDLGIEGGALLREVMLRASAMSCLTGIAARKSCDEKRPINIGDLVRLS
jgi:hypothetical protein